MVTKEQLLPLCPNHHSLTETNRWTVDIDVVFGMQRRIARAIKKHRG